MYSKMQNSIIWNGNIFCLFYVYAKHNLTERVPHC